MPVVGKGIAGEQTCLYHDVSLQAFLPSVHLPPDTRTAIIVLTDSMAHNDAADWIGQPLLEAVLDDPDTNNCVSLARDTAATSTGLWKKMSDEPKKKQTPDTAIKPNSQCVGLYWNLISDWRIEVFGDQGSLQMYFQGNKSQTYWLDHYHYDTFTWLLTRDEDVHHGRCSVISPEFYLTEFRHDSGENRMTQSIWKHDSDVPEGEILFLNPHR